MPFFYIDYTFIIIIPAIIFAAVCQARVKSTYQRYRISNRRHLTGAMAAQELLQRNGITDVQIEMTSGTLTDHFDPRKKVIRLSPDVFRGDTIASVGIACHEAGHAVQHAKGYFPLKIRNVIIPVCNLGSTLGIPLALAGLIFSFRPLILVGLILYATVAVFQLITLPVEFNASRRALATIEETQMLDSGEYQGAKKVLTAAALTYVAALLSSLATLLRLLLILGRRGNNR